MPKEHICVFSAQKCATCALTDINTKISFAIVFVALKLADRLVVFFVFFPAWTTTKCKEVRD